MKSNNSNLKDANIYPFLFYKKLNQDIQDKLADYPVSNENNRFPTFLGNPSSSSLINDGGNTYNFYPSDPRLPIGKNFGKIKINYVKVYHTPLGKFLKAHRNNQDRPELFLDLESPKENFKVQKETELHLGISARFRVHSLELSKSVKDHIDIYIPLSELDSLIMILNKIRKVAS